MWFGTFKGINKYDGYTLTHYLPNKKDSTSISNSNITDILGQDDGTFWVATSQGVNIYNPKTNTFHKIPHQPNAGFDGVSEDSRTLCQYTKDSVLIGTATGVWLYEKSKERISHFIEESRSQLVRNIRLDKQGKLWIGTENGGLLVYNPKSKTSKWFKTNEKDKGTLSSNNIFHTFEDSKGSIWIGTTNGLCRFNPTNEKFTRYVYHENEKKGPPKGEAHVIHEDPWGRLWIGFQYGLALYDRKTDGFTTFTHNPADRNSISGNETWSLFNDNKGTLWVGSFNSGINKLEHEKTTFNLYQYDSDNPLAISANSVMAFHEDKIGNVYLGIDHGGLNYFDRSTNTFTHYQNKENDLQSISSDAVLCLDIDHQGNVWAGTWGGGLNRFNAATGTFQHFLPNEKHNSISGTNIWAIKEDKKHRIWTGTHGQGISVYNPSTKKFRNYLNSNGGQSIIANNLVWDIEEDKNGTIWLGTASGISKYNEANDSFDTMFNRNDGSGITLQVFDLLSDEKGILWLGTGENGVVRYEPETGAFEFITKEDGLLDNTITTLSIDKNGILWLGTNSGLCRLDPTTKNIRTFDSSSGLNGNQFNYGASALLTTGELVFGGKKGFLMFHPDSIKSNTFVPPVVFTDLQIFNISQEISTPNSPLQQHVNHTRAIELEYSQSVFSLSYAALDFTTPEKNQYAYKLEGFDNEWQYVENKRNVTYTNLNPGKYVFKVRASNSDGLWNDEPAEMKIKIIPPWWMTWWFRAFSVLVITGGAFLFYYMRMRRVQRQKKELEHQVKVRTKELQEANINLRHKQEEVVERNVEILSINEQLEETNTRMAHQHELINSSIRYGKTIQQAVLPLKSRMDKNFESFIIYRPKDVVSGDYYWYTREMDNTPSETLFIAVADCTGHGVPGAFMSMIGISLLNEIVRVKHIYSPKEILAQLNKGVRKALKQEETENNDGIAISLCTITKNKDGSRSVTFSGAKSNVYKYDAQANRMERIKGSSIRIGGKRSLRKELAFEEHLFHLNSGDQLFLYSDGIIDQSNYLRKRFGSARFQSLLEEIVTLPLSEQEEKIKNTLDNFQNGEGQRDDITVMGIRFS